MEFHSIQSNEDIQLFLEKANSLHDGYVIGVQYTNHAAANLDENGYVANPEATKLVIRILVTSIWNTVVEIEFENLLEWQVLSDTYYDVIFDTSVSFNDKGYIVWADTALMKPDDLEGSTYAIAKSMKWRVVK